MPQAARRTCLICHGHSDDVGPISWAGRCETCGKARQNENHDQLKAGEGPFSEHWENRLVMAIARRQVKRLRAS